LSVAPHDTYGLVSAVMPRKRYGLRGAARHIGSVRRCDGRRISMGPIPGNILCIRVMNIARCRLRNISDRFAIRWPVGEVPFCRPDDRCIVSPVMPERRGKRPMGNRMRREPSTNRCSRPGQCLVRGNHDRYYAERGDKRHPIHSIHHGTYQCVGLLRSPPMHARPGLSCPQMHN
jgi:hypothetical protein